MNNFKKLVPVLLSAGVLMACNRVDSADLEENWVEYVTEGAEELESYSTEINLDVRAAFQNQVDESQVTLEGDIIGDFDRGHVIMTADGATNELFFDGDSVFIREEGIDWQDASGQPVATETSYENVLEAVLRIEHLLEVEHTEGQLHVSYVGSDQEVWDTFLPPFSLNIEGFEIEEVVMTLDVLFDDEDFFMQDFELDLEAGEEQAGVHMNILVDYENHNEIDSFEVEEEIQSLFDL